MYNLYHFPLCPFSRFIRILLIEKQVSFKLIEEHIWKRNYAFAKLNPAFELPVLSLGNTNISSIYALCEYLETNYPEAKFSSSNSLDNAEIHRLVSWFSNKFYNEVTKYLFEEKVVLHYVGGHSPRVNFIRAAINNLSYHLDYIEFLLQERKWLAGNHISLADLIAAAQLSTLDYLGDIDWNKHPTTKEWYAILKSRPSFRPILVDRIKGFTPPPHYQNLDF